jgi:hypothetical protein
MVLIKEDDVQQGNIIYYIRKGIVGLELRYSDFEKLALEAVDVV